MVYGFRPDIIQTPTGPRLVEPSEVPSREEILEFVQNVGGKDQLRVEKRTREQQIPCTTLYEEGEEVWVINHDTSKLASKQLGPYTVTKVNYDTNTYELQDSKGKLRKLQAEQIRPCQARRKFKELREAPPTDLLEEYGLRESSSFPKSL